MFVFKLMLSIRKMSINEKNRMTIVDLGIYRQMIYKKKISINGKNKKKTMISMNKKDEEETNEKS